MSFFFFFSPLTSEEESTSAIARCASVHRSASKLFFIDSDFFFVCVLIFGNSTISDSDILAAVAFHCRVPSFYFHLVSLCF